MKDIIDRLKSPVVIIQIVSIIASCVVTLLPEKEVTVNTIVYSLTAVINVLAGLNNPTDKNNF